ncbi:PREDICTED: uncharacterized protein LOC105555748, partial [Vollenhovia emeryi]|uniref:uncharacterized protein LOC105555748 n=1 Tax=Vollenhovia emeryi TaxID=411798 RepID=UPI0005F3D7E9
PSTDEESSSVSSVDATTGKRKRRGRPATTYAGIGKRKREECRREIKKLKAEQRALAEVLNPKALPRDTTPERETVAQLEGLSGAQIAAEMLQNVNIVVKVAERSKNLKGTYVKELKACSKNLRAAATVVAKKTAGSSGGRTNDENERLRERVRSLEEQLERMATLLQEERETRARVESTRALERTAMELPEEDPSQARAQSPARSEVTERLTRAKALARRKAANPEKPVPVQAEEAPVYRPKIKGAKKKLEEPTPEEAMEGVRRVLEGVSLKDVAKGNPQEVRQKLENTITRCQGARARIPRGQETGLARGVPVITKMEVVRDMVTAKAKDTAAQIIRSRKVPKEKAPAPSTTEWVEV